MPYLIASRPRDLIRRLPSQLQTIAQRRLCARVSYLTYDADSADSALGDLYPSLNLGGLAYSRPPRHGSHENAHLL
jgi:hypothetical protein